MPTTTVLWIYPTASIWSTRCFAGARACPVALPAMRMGIARRTFPMRSTCLPTSSQLACHRERRSPTAALTRIPRPASSARRAAASKNEPVSRIPGFGARWGDDSRMVELRGHLHRVLAQKAELRGRVSKPGEPRTLGSSWPSARQDGLQSPRSSLGNIPTHCRAYCARALRSPGFTVG